MEIREALTFDDVLLEPSRSAVLPADTDVTARLTREINLNIPLLSAAMDTVTEHRLAIAMAQAGGIGVVHKNMSIEAQAGEISRVKKYESGMVVNPLTITPDRTLGDALELMKTHQISGIPVVDGDGKPSRSLDYVVVSRDWNCVIQDKCEDPEGLSRFRSAKGDGTRAYFDMYSWYLGRSG